MPHGAHRRSVAAPAARLKPVDRDEYVRRVFDAYRITPGTTGVVRRADRLLAGELYDRGVPVEAVENALLLAAARRLIRPVPLPPVRSLHYFLPVIEEVKSLEVSPEYFRYLKSTIHKM